MHLEDDDRILQMALASDIKPHNGPAMAKACQDCPFEAEKAGRGYLTEERWLQIKSCVALGQPFYCHKTVYVPKTEMQADGEPVSYQRHFRMCKGALEWLEQAKKTKLPTK